MRIEHVAHEALRPKEAGVARDHREIGVQLKELEGIGEPSAGSRRVVRVVELVVLQRHHHITPRHYEPLMVAPYLVLIRCEEQLVRRRHACIRICASGPRGREGDRGFRPAGPSLPAHARVHSRRQALAPNSRRLIFGTLWKPDQINCMKNGHTK